MALGAIGYLTKPIDREQLVKLLRPYQKRIRRSKVLVVDDDAAQCERVRLWLPPQHWSISEAENGRVALERLAEETPDVVILDLMMPEMDGFQLVTALQAHEQWRNIPVIVITALDLTAEDRARLNSGVEQVLTKGSFDPARLVELVRQAGAKTDQHREIAGAAS
jgi:CheY-like chemotaxis protein